MYRFFIGMVIVGFLMAGCLPPEKLQSPIVPRETVASAKADPVVIHRGDSVSYLQPVANQLVEMPGMNDQRVAKFRDTQNGYMIYLTTNGGIAVIKE